MTTTPTKLCNKPTCHNPKADDSVCCAFHRDQKKALNQEWRDRKHKGLPKRKPGRKPKEGDPEVAMMYPLKRPAPAAVAATASIQLAIDERREQMAVLTHEIGLLEGTLQMLQAPMVGARR